MNTTKATPRKLVIIFQSILLAACLMTDQPQEGQVDNQIRAGVVSTVTRQAFLKQVEDARETQNALETSDQIPTQSATPQPSSSPEPSTTPAPSATQEVIFEMIPGAPLFVKTYIRDTLSVELAGEKSTIGDDYAWSRFERPFSAETMLYRGDLDISQINLDVRDDWVYITFHLAEKLPVKGSSYYAVDLDLDHDGRGDYLISAGLPPDSSWTTDGVSVYKDENQDIGGFYPLYMEEVESNQDGYEAVLVSDGDGLEPDLAWVRRDPKQQNQIQLAFKYNLTGSAGFLWSGWAVGGELDPGIFDINDQITFEEAGSPNIQNYRYPLKKVALIDSTCRSWYGYLPTGNEPNLCYTGALVVERPGYGWCQANPFSNSCEENACLVNCPEGKFCLPCKLNP